MLGRKVKNIADESVRELDKVAVERDQICVGIRIFKMNGKSQRQHFGRILAESDVKFRMSFCQISAKICVP